MSSLLRNILICIAFTTFAVAPVIAQNTVNVWYFGDSAGIDFNTGAPVVLSDGVMSTEEGCATICNAAGNLLFYSNGINVWNRQHIIMPNGSNLLGNMSASQSGIIVPRPTVNNLYYVFSVDDLGGADGLRYSEVDMNLQGGFGDVTIKNQPLAGPVAEKVTAVNHANNVDFWVIAHGWNNDVFYAYLVTAAGINTTPVVTNIGAVHGGFSFNSVGCMKGSHDGMQLALTVYGDNLIQIFDFDNATGVVSNPISVTNPGIFHPYGVEFSPSNDLLYVTNQGANNCLQLDLSSGTSAGINASLTWVSTNSDIVGSLQLAPDNKIYVARNNALWLGRIDNPDAPGLACGYVHNGLNLLPHRSWLGLPNFIQNIFITPFIISGDSCLGDFTQFSLTSTANIDSVRWDFDDPASGSNTSTLLSPTHVFSDSGSYHVICIYYHSGLVDTAHDFIHIVMPPAINFGADVSLCPGLTLTLNGCWPGATYLWENGSDTCVRVLDQAGQYWLEVSNRCGSPRDTIQLSYFAQTIVNPGNDTVRCLGDTAFFDAGPGHQFIQWNTGAQTQIIAATEEGYYSVYVIDANGCAASGDARLRIDPCHQYLFMPTGFTPNGDGLNDLFAPVPGGDKISVTSFTIYNRWGMLVFSSQGDGWDGMYKNQFCPEGVYTWRVSFVDEYGDAVQQAGNVTLVR